MLIVFIIFGLIILVSFITGVVLTVYENKNNVSLTDDPKTLFEEDKKDIVPIEEPVKKDDIVVVSEQVNNINPEPFVLETPVLETVQENGAVNFNSKEENKENVLEPRFVCCNIDLEQEEII